MQLNLFTLLMVPLASASVTLKLFSDNNCQTPAPGSGQTYVTSGSCDTGPFQSGWSSAMIIDNGGSPAGTLNFYEKNRCTSDQPNKGFSSANFACLKDLNFVANALGVLVSLRGVGEEEQVVHGAYHRAWHLKFLKEELEKTGHQVSTFDLPSCGEDAPAEKAKTVDTQAIKAVIEEAATQSDTIIPVFHSYSGLPGSDAVAELSDAARKKVSVTSDGLYRYVSDPIPPFYHDVEPELAQEAARRWVRGSASAYSEKTKHAGWKLYPRKFIFCNDDRAAPRERLMKMFDSMSEEDRAGWKFEEIDGSHSPFLPKPAECARLLIKIIDQDIA